MTHFVLSYIIEGMLWSSSMGRYAGFEDVFYGTFAFGTLNDLIITQHRHLRVFWMT